LLKEDRWISVIIGKITDFKNEFKKYGKEGGGGI
jgi:hypothetical protein